MESEKFLPCKSCGKLLNSSASTCPQCGDPNPFGWEKKEIIHRAKVHSIMVLFVSVIGVVVAFLQFGLVRPVWLSFIAYFVVIFLLVRLKKRLNKTLLLRMRQDIRTKFYWVCQDKNNYNLSPEQFDIWANKAEKIYSDARILMEEE